MRFFSVRKALPLSVISAVVLLIASCGSDPTATPTPNPTATPTPTPTLAPGVPTPTPRPATATPTPSPTPSWDAASYFKGQTIRINVGFSPGGGYDQISRIFASVAPKYFPGSPKFVVSNLPGSGGLRALQTTTSSKGDGLSVNPMPTGRFLLPEMVGTDVEGYDAFNAKYVGTPTYSPTQNAFCMRRDVATTWDEVLALGRNVKSGVSALGGYGIGISAAEYLGAPMTVVTGYGGTAEIQAALDRGELDGTPACDFPLIQGLFPEWFDNDFIVPVYWWNNPVTQDFLDALDAPAPPYIWDVLSATQEQQDAFAIAEAAEDYIRMFVLSDDTPDNILQAWRSGFQTIVESPEFKQKAEVAGLQTGYGNPEDLIPLLAKGKTFTAEGKDFIKYLYGL